jgi:phosphatidyl-myo-inositol alpha-mannosyltransferase
MSDNRLRVGIVYDDTLDRYGGVPLYVTTLGATLVRRGHQVEYLVGSSAAAEIGGAPVHSLARNVKVRFNGNALSMPAWSRGRDLTRVLDAGRYDVLHVQVPYSPLMAGRLLTRAGPRCAVVGTYHVASSQVLPSVGALLLRALKLRSAPRFDEIVSVSEVAAEFAAKWSRMEARRIVPNMLDLSSIPRRTPRLLQHRADIVFVGRLVPRKGVRRLIDAVALLQERSEQPPSVAIIGDGPLRGRLQRHAGAAGLSDRVFFLGEVDDQCKLETLSQAKVACFPSLFGESFGLVILEALAAGADVVVAGDNPGYRVLLGRTDSLVDPSDAVAFSSKLQLLLEDDSARRRLGARQRRLLAPHDSEVVVDEVLEVYRRALARRRRLSVLPRPAKVALDVAA